MKFYQIENPTTKQIFDAIVNNDYVPLEKIEPKAKQIKVLLADYFNTDEIFVTFSSVTNSGGIPIFFSVNDFLYDVTQKRYKDWYEMSEEEQNEYIEILGFYATTFDDIFNL